MRNVGSYEELNKQTMPIHYPLPNLNQWIHRTSAKKVHGKMDCRKAFHQLLVRKCDIPKTAVVGPDDCKEFLRGPMGTKNITIVWQRNMDIMFEGLIPDKMQVFVDDFHIYGNTYEEFAETVEEVLAGVNLVIAADKCELAFEEVNVLGYDINSKGKSIMHDKVRAIRELPSPLAIRQSRTKNYRWCLARSISIMNLCQIFHRLQLRCLVC